MKTIFKSLLCVMLAMLLCSAALAEPRYPEKNSQTTDSAAVLSQETVKELADYYRKLADETDVNLHVVTVDFLDGETLDRYAEGLRAKWRLGDKDLLLLLAVGEDKFGSWGGKDINRRLSESVQGKLLSANLEDPFLRQDYDGAIRAYIPALTQEINKSFDADVDISGLFGTAVAASEQNWDEWAQDWTQRLTESHTAPVYERSVRQRVTEEDEDTGFSLGKVILTVFLLSVIFGNRGKRGRKGCGCGCAPFSSILAGLGLWKLWDRD